MKGKILLKRSTQRNTVLPHKILHLFKTELVKQRKNFNNTSTIIHFQKLNNKYLQGNVIIYKKRKDIPTKSLLLNRVL